MESWLSKKLNHKFCWASKVSKVSFAVMDKDWIGSDDKLDDIVFNIERNGKQTASGAKGSKVDLVVSGFVKEAEKEEEKQEKSPKKKAKEEPEEEKQEEPPKRKMHCNHFTGHAQLQIKANLMTVSAKTTMT